MDDQAGHFVRWRGDVGVRRQVVSRWAVWPEGPGRTAARAMQVADALVPTGGPGPGGRLPGALEVGAAGRALDVLHAPARASPGSVGCGARRAGAPGTPEIGAALLRPARGQAGAPAGQPPPPSSSPVRSDPTSDDPSAPGLCRAPGGAPSHQGGPWPPGSSDGSLASARAPSRSNVFRTPPRPEGDFRRRRGWLRSWRGPGGPGAGPSRMVGRGGGGGGHLHQGRLHRPRDRPDALAVPGGWSHATIGTPPVVAAGPGCGRKHRGELRHVLQDS